MLKIQKQCFTAQGIDISLPTVSKENTKFGQKKSYMDAVIAQKANLVCAQPVQFQAALDCALTHTRACMPQDYWGLLPEASNMSKFVSTLCDKENRVDFECVKRRASNLYDCGIRKGQEAFGSGAINKTMQNILCKAFQFNAECQVTELRVCGCDTVRAYEIVSRDLLYPPDCPPLPDRPRVQCGPTNEFLFLDNSGSVSCQHLAFPLCVCVVLILLELFL
ncbi:hypothetical protein BsWGS_24733 [Bradybaena similaris]